MAAPTLINLPEPPSNPDTPTDAPGTPNSTTTSISALSTIAIKDGHRGTSFPHTGYGHHHTSSSNTLEAERADRISRLAGLERVSTARAPNQYTPGGSQVGPSNANAQIPGYFDQNGNPVYTRGISTVGSASATGSAGGRTTTWASSSQKGGQTEGDDMSVDTSEREVDDDRYSASAMDEDDEGGMSDNASLVGFGEGAGSTVSAPIYTRRADILGRSLLTAQSQREGSNSTPQSDGIATSSTSMSTNVETAQGILRDRIDGEGRAGLASPEEAGLAKFYFEEKK